MRKVICLSFATSSFIQFPARTADDLVHSGALVVTGVNPPRPKVACVTYPTLDHTCVKARKDAKRTRERINLVRRARQRNRPQTVALLHFPVHDSQSTFPGIAYSAFTIHYSTLSKTGLTTIYDVGSNHRDEGA